MPVRAAGTSFFHPIQFYSIPEFLVSEMLPTQLVRRTYEERTDAEELINQRVYILKTGDTRIHPVQGRQR
jgi:hypothetical protein